MARIVSNCGICVECGKVRFFYLDNVCTTGRTKRAITRLLDFTTPRPGDNFAVAECPHCGTWKYPARGIAEYSKSPSLIRLQLPYTRGARSA